MRLVYAALVLALSASPALAQRAPVIVIPGRTDVPVILNGVDVSYAVIEGEFGLSRPNMVNPTVIYRPFVIPLVYGPDLEPESYPRERHYFPSTGRRPGYGRLEIIPPADRPLPPPAPTFYRSWSSQSGSGPVTDYAPYPYPMPDVFVGSRFRTSRGARPEPHAQCGRARREPEESVTSSGRPSSGFTLIRLLVGQFCKGVPCLSIA